MVSGCSLLCQRCQPWMLFGLEQRNYILRRRQLFALQSQLLGRLPQLYSIAADDGRWHVQQGRVALVYHTECELPLCGDSRSSTTSAPASCLLLRLQCARWLLGRIVLEHDWLQHGCRIACLRLLARWHGGGGRFGRLAGSCARQCGRPRAMSGRLAPGWRRRVGPAR